MPALLTTNGVTACVECFEHIAVAHRSGHHRDTSSLHRPMKPKIAHHCDNDCIAAESALGLQLQRRQRNQAVAIDDVSFVINCNHAVTIAVEGKTCVGPVLEHSAYKRGWMRCAAFGVDVRAIRRGVHHDDLGTQRCHCGWASNAHCTIGTVEHHSHPREAVGRKQRHNVLHIFGHCIDNNISSRVRRRRDWVISKHYFKAGLDRRFDIVGELQTTDGKDLHAIIRIRIV